MKPKLTNTLAAQALFSDDLLLSQVKSSLGNLLYYQNPKSQQNLYLILMAVHEMLNQQCVFIGDKNAIEYEKYHELQKLVSDLAIKCDEFKVKEGV